MSTTSSALTHNYGCGVAINAPLAIVPIRTLQNLALNPNFGGEVMVVGLGCEKLVPERLLPEGDRQQRRADAGRGVRRVRRHRRRHHGKWRMRGLPCSTRAAAKPVPASDLVIGLQCGGSDAFSGVTANPALGFAADLLVRAGAAVMFSEVTEVRDAIHLLTRRAANEDVGRALIREMDWYDGYLAKGDADRSANTTPGNKKGGLANIVEKSLGSIVKSGTSAIVDVLAPGERVRTKGMIFAATPASDFICGTLQLASGMTLQVFTTGRGTPYGLAAAPVIKVVDPHRTGAALEGSDRLRRRPHRHRRSDDRGNRLGPVPPDPRCRERPHQGVVRPLGHSQRSDAVHAGAGDLRLHQGRLRSQFRMSLTIGPTGLFAGVAGARKLRDRCARRFKSCDLFKRTLRNLA